VGAEGARPPSTSYPYAWDVRFGEMRTAAQGPTATVNDRAEFGYFLLFVPDTEISQDRSLVP